MSQQMADSSSTMMMYEICAQTDRGRLRQNNEDAFAFDARTGLCLLADGMGGYKAGEIARSFGFASFTLREVSINANDQGPPPRPRTMAMSAKSDMAEAAIPVEAGKSTVMVNVSGSVQMTPGSARP